MSLEEKELLLIRKALLGQIQEIDKTLSFQDESGVVELDQEKMGRLSRVDAILRQEMAIKQRTDMIARKGDLQKALFRLKRYSDEFGICEDCDELIPIPRLLAVPSATRCVECQEDFDAEYR